jgi:N4-(beta-N-acetylglucosaminyl)-L-asparaginase
MSRRKFIKQGALGVGFLLLGEKLGLISESKAQVFINQKGKPKVISTWRHGVPANEEAWKKLKGGGSALDAVEQGVRHSESDANNLSVGLGGLPDRDGNVTLDACIMNHEHECGAVAFLQHIENPISVARKVMEDTPHVMLVGKGALEFALEKGFKKTNLLTEKAKKRWEEWKQKSNYNPPVNIENHDTIGMIAMDKDGNISGACTTSGLAYKLHGRVGDSPMIGAGLFVDNEVGGACATGVGEMVIRTAGSHLVVELMRQGKSPQDACKMAVERIIAKHKSVEGRQVGYLAMNKKGETGAYSIHQGFNYALQENDEGRLLDAEFIVKR